MALIKSVIGFTPKIGENCYLADNSTIIGDVVIGKDCSIWFNAVLRGDVNAIRIDVYKRQLLLSASINAAIHAAACTHSLIEIAPSPVLFSHKLYRFSRILHISGT